MNYKMCRLYNISGLIVSSAGFSPEQWLWFREPYWSQCILCSWPARLHRNRSVVFNIEKLIWFLILYMWQYQNNWFLTNHKKWKIHISKIIYVWHMWFFIIYFYFIFPLQYSQVDKIGKCKSNIKFLNTYKINFIQ